MNLGWEKDIFKLILIVRLFFTILYILTFTQNYRGMTTSLSALMFDAGIMSLSLIAYLAKDWHVMSFVIAWTVTPMFIFHFIIPQSLQFLYTRFSSSFFAQ